jgi:hypothetical protein
MAHLLVPICFISAWTFIFLLVRQFWVLFQDTARHSAQLHQIPCSHCRFSTDNHQLKCTVHPAIAMTEAATDCQDYRLNRSPLEEFLHSTATDESC